MAEAEVRKLVTLRGSVKGSLTKLHNFVQNYESLPIEQRILGHLRVRKPKLDALWDKYDELQKELEVIDPDTYSDDRDNFETQFYDTQVLYEKHLSTKQDNSVSVATNSTNQTSQSGSNATILKSVNLPQIKLPTFSGNYTEWSNFRDMFKSLVHDDKQISPIQKLYYLKSSLTGEAAQVIAAVNNDTDSYAVAYQLLEERYNNNYLIINNHLACLLNVPAMTKFSATTLRSIIINTKQHLRSLKNFLTLIESWDPFVIYMICQKLDNITKREWELQVPKNEMPSLESFYEFLESRCRAFEISETQTKPKEFQTSKANNHILYAPTAEDKVCKICDKGTKHNLYQCKTFLESDVNKRINHAKNLGVCFNCLKPSHNAATCQGSSCRKCQKKHNTLLHLDGTTKSNSSSQGQTSTQPSQSAVTCSKYNTSSKDSVVPTAVVRVQDIHNNWHTCRVLIDQGSQSNIVLLGFIKRLGLNYNSNKLIISGVGGKISGACGSIKIRICSINNSFNTLIECCILDKITNNLPNNEINSSEIFIPKGLPLADPDFCNPNQIDLLIGAGLLSEILLNGVLRFPSENYILQETVFGWIISGQLPVQNKGVRSTNVSHTIQSNEETLLTRFWELEEMNDHLPLTNEEKYCEQHFVNTTERDNNGRFIVKLPLNSDPQEIGDTFKIANKRFYLLERKFEKDPQLHEQYSLFINDYINLNHMERAEPIQTDDNQSHNQCYLPHHAVFKDSTTTKLRVVFDASALGSNGKSLNDILFSGPTIQQSLLSIIIRFRTHKIAFSADIEKMFRQILVHPSQTDLQRILWRNNTSEPIDCFKLKTVTYGTTCAPYLATKTLQYLSELEGKNFPSAANVLARDFYMDDLLSGSNNLENALIVQREIISLLATAGFHLRKWCSNHESVLAAVEPKDRETNLPFNFDNKTHIKTLGLLWLPAEDNFKFSIQVVKGTPSDIVTKRTVLSEVARIFDPLGLLGPIVIRAKLFIQELWKLKVEWDNELDQTFINRWLEFKEELLTLKEFQIPRRVITLDKEITSVQIHGFCDSSQVAYGACIYLRATDNSGNVSVHNLCAKSRVAPVRSTTIPRLELCGALLLTKLIEQIIPILHLEIEQVYLWCDSMIVLAWLKSHANRWSAFVANRVAQIQDSTANYIWNYVPSQENPADLLTRGVTPQELQSSLLWWHGPEWLLNPEPSPCVKEQDISNIDLPEQRKKTNVLINVNQCDIIQKFSSLTKLQRVLAYCLRFLSNLKTKKAGKATINNYTLKPLTVIELQNSLNLIIKLVQHEHFSEEIHCLQTNRPLPNSSKLLSLNPFLDENNILRVGGRLKYSTLSYQSKYPIILPKHQFTDLLIKREHIQLLHAGTQGVLASIRNKYWPVNAKNTIRKLIHKCITCCKFRQVKTSQLMGNLPKCRVTPSRPFLNTGVDYAGPVYLKRSKYRNTTLVKGYIAIFVCMVTKAIHIELVSDLSTPSFLAALKRFISRRGRPANIFSDNGSNFKGASHDLKELFKLFNNNNNAISETLSLENIQWHFIPPYSAHFGGIWESGVKSIKYHIKRVIGSVNLTFEEMYTILTQIESCLNSRPLTPISSDPSDLSVLTPSHFLIGESLSSIPEPDMTHQPENRLSRWQLVQKLTQDIWKKWSREYLNSLQERSKWKRKQPSFNINDMVLLKEETSPLTWKMGRVVSLHPGDDGLIRVVSVRTSSGVTKRAVTKLMKLPVEHDFGGGVCSVPETGVCSIPETATRPAPSLGAGRKEVASIASSTSNKMAKN